MGYVFIISIAINTIAFSWADHKCSNHLITQSLTNEWTPSKRLLCVEKIRNLSLKHCTVRVMAYSHMQAAPSTSKELNLHV